MDWGSLFLEQNQKVKKIRDFVSNFVCLDLTVNATRLLIEGDEIWKSLDSLLGATLIAAFKFTLYPITLSPTYLNVNDIVKGTDKVNMKITFGTGEDGSKIKFKDITLIVSPFFFPIFFFLSNISL